MDKELLTQMKMTFDQIAHKTSSGLEYWCARELQQILGYKRWENFFEVLTRAQKACLNSGGNIEDHFRETTKLTKIGSASVRKISDFFLTRYACYLIAQNGDASKTEIAFAQTYFALQTRKLEILEERLEDLHRMQIRSQLREAEKRLSQNIYERGVDDTGFARIRSKGDKALFGSSTADMKVRYKIKQARPLADFLPPITLAAKNLATEMTNLHVETDDLRGELFITREHVQNNTSIRDMLLKRGIIPEELPPAEDIKKVERRAESDIKKLSSSAEKLPDTLEQEDYE
ncbi:MAG: DNA damage-inducible protein D [Oscillospiraceae bacterium]|nr:DNA damage-inducible protein D [Oscillospiraceae bacterium]